MPPSASSRSAGVLAPVFALRHERDFGVGDTLALRQLLDWAAEHRIGFVQLLPINEMGPDNSPYNAISSVALDPVFLEMSTERVPGLEDADVAAVLEEVEWLRGDLVDFDRARDLKRQLLRRAFERQTAAGFDESFHRFCREEKNWLEGYAVFRSLMEEHGHELWDQWPEKSRESIDPRGPQATFHAWAQWVAFTQWRELRAYGQKIGVRLMGDIPIGVSYYSADVFSEPQWFDLEWSGGAPPETIFKDDLFVQKWGQNWGIPLYRWDALEADGFRWWRQRIERLTDVFDIFRIDHVLGFYRIYGFPWRPQRNGEFLELSEEEAMERTGGRLPGYKEFPDDTPAHCAANLAAGDRYLRMVQEAAGDAVVIGEDLGSVPDYVRPHLLQLGVPGFKVPQWEVVEETDQVIPGADYEECSFATYATHDHPPMRSLWEQNRHNMHHHPEHEDRMNAGRELRLLAQFIGMGATDSYPEYVGAVQWQMMRALLASRSRYAACMITDLFAMEDRFNVPGVVSEANWRSRLPFTVTELCEDARWSEPSAMFRAVIEQTGRA